MNSEEIMDVLPHRPPFLLVDKIVEIEPGKKAVGIKNVTVNEPFFKGHFPGIPIMPGVLIVEALAQVGACALLSLPEYKGKIPLFVGIEKFKFRKTVKPGDVLILEVKVLKMRRNFGKAEARAIVSDEVVAEGELLFGVSDAEE
jgi:3-hydroxyacyl-[acyl-carrier-protein] dehydratase